MEQGLFQASIAIGRSLRQQEIHAANIANVDTPGFRRQVVAERAFGSLLEKEMGRGMDQFMETARDFAPGNFVNTGNPLDVAIDGPGMLAVQGRDETLYTRNGVLTLTSEGTLTTRDGWPVLGESGSPIVLDPNGGNPRISADGSISQGGNTLGKLRIVEFDSPGLLEARGVVYYRARQGVLPREGSESGIQQGYREQSNVRLMDEMVTMMTTFRQLEHSQKALTSINDTLTQLVQTSRAP